MTPEEKATEIMSKFTFASIYFKDGEQGAKKNGKACAIIHVDEIIKTDPIKLVGNSGKFTYETDYWQSVKSHLLKM